MKRAILLAGREEISLRLSLREYSVVSLRACAELISARSSGRVIRGVVGRELVEGWGGRVERTAHVHGWSSIGLIESLKGRKR